ncbi:cysteine hydrolase family protein [Hydrogenophaga sp. BPS33]|uniref:cysteine hydrolase family protein n=1 Tax=Hydrogenophaga sp. BPS33 TaxID=2651974 RepID=UPI0013200B90|nr:isochorismatase family cysteine hydrolase [Hydrogenophaga sp. BPS33]QHE87121.1 cysteine hydrolase [Hydrogenophaga sp. BPS33]
MDESDLPRSRRALLLIDFINPLDFPQAPDLAPSALTAAKAASRLARAARDRNIPVIYANDNFGRWRSDFSTLVVRLSKGHSPSASIARLLRPQRGDLTLLKPMHSAFFGTPLDILLDQIGVRSLIIAGLATDICIQLSAADAFLRRLSVHAPEDCTAAESPQKKEAALAYMRDILKCDTRPWQRSRWWA